jgi:uncharacterized lipoprotein
MNKQLYGKNYPLPNKLVKYLDQCFNHVKNKDENTEGFRRNRDLVSKKQVSYSVLKRIKNWFDNFKGKKNDAPYILNGGDYMRNWVNSSLEMDRKGIERSSDNRENTGMDNNSKPSSSDAKVGKDNIDMKVEKLNIAVTESLKRINEIMSKLL